MIPKDPNGSDQSPPDQFVYLDSRVHMDREQDSTRSAPAECSGAAAGPCHKHVVQPGASGGFSSSEDPVETNGLHANVAVVSPITDTANSRMFTHKQSAVSAACRTFSAEVLDSCCDALRACRVTAAPAEPVITGV